MSLIPTKFVVGYFFAIGLVLVVLTLVVSGVTVWSPILFGLILVLGSVFSRTEYGLVKQLPISVSALIWCVTSIILAFLPYLFNFTSLEFSGLPVLLWSCILISVLNLVVILLGKINLDDSAQV